MYQSQKQDRFVSAAGVAFFHALLGYAFIVGLGIDVTTAVDEKLKIFDVPDGLPPPIEEAIPAKKKNPEKAKRIKPAPKDPEGAAAPPNLKARPTEIVAPEPEVKLPVPPPVVAAPVAGPGAQASAGASTRPGPGTGAGGQGRGLGSGAYGDGTGGGGGGGVATPARWISGRIRDSDYPRGAWESGRGGIVYLRFVVAPSGRVGSCTVTRTSGSRDLDDVTCRLIVQRFRYRPARDAWGQPVPYTIRGEHVWEAHREPDRWIDAVPVDE